MSFLAKVIDDIPNISVITEIEALSWVNPDKNKESIVKAFIDDARIFPLTQDIVLQCVRIRRSRKIKTPDAILAATAITHDFILISGDKGFDHIQGLQVIDPYSL